MIFIIIPCIESLKLMLSDEDFQTDVKNNSPKTMCRAINNNDVTSNHVPPSYY